MGRMAKRGSLRSCSRMSLPVLPVAPATRTTAGPRAWGCGSAPVRVCWVRSLCASDKLASTDQGSKSEDTKDREHGHGLLQRWLTENSPVIADELFKARGRPAQQALNGVRGVIDCASRYGLELLADSLATPRARG